MCRTQAELVAARARYFDLYDQAPSGYLTISESGLILEANLTAATRLGLPRGALVQQPISRFISPADQDAYYRHRKLLLASGAPQDFDLRMRTADGTPFWVLLAMSVAQDAAGAPVCRAMLSDITEIKQAAEALRESQEMLQHVIAAAQDAIIVMDPQGRISLWNEAAHRILGYSATEAVGQPLHTLIIPTRGA